MQDFLVIIILTAAAGGCIPLGGFIARREHIQPDWLRSELRHALIAFGGGILLGATSVALIPEGRKALENSPASVLLVLAGGLVFFFIERRLGLKRHEAPQLTGMVLDYLPESIALGGMAALGSDTTYLMALLIGLQNLPEGFNSYRELRDNNPPAKTLQIMCTLVLLGPAAGLAGYFLLADYPEVLGGIMLVAAGGILYLIFQDIAPQARLEKRWAPPLGAVCGFCLALFGDLLLV